jgi:hypothetical protein
MSVGLQNVDNEFETNLNIPTPVQRKPKYYNITDVNNQNFGGGATSYRVDSLDELRELPKELWNRKITPQYQMGGNIYPVNYVSQTQNGNIIPSDLPDPINGIIYDPEGERTYYDSRLDRIVLTPSTNFSPRQSVINHEKFHKYQFDNLGSNYEIAHQGAIPMFKKPSMVSTDEEYYKFHNRKGREAQQDIENVKSNYPEFKFVPNEVLFDKLIDREQYSNPYTLEGEAQSYENSLNKFQMGGSMPGSVGFTYARTKGIPSEGPYAKKTLPSAQNGKKQFKLKDERLEAIRPSESTSVKRKDFDLEQAKENKAYINAVAAQKKEAARRKKLTQDQREREDYNAYNQERGSVEKYVPESTWDRTKAIVSNPLTAFGYAARNQSLPKNFQYGERNVLDNAIDWINPLQGAASLSEILGELGRGEFLNAGLSALDAADLGVYAKGAKQLRNINPEGKIFNGLNKQLDEIAIKNTERYMAKRTPSNTPLSKEMNPQLLDNFDPGEYTPFQEDDYMKWFNAQKDKLNPRPVKQDPRSILRRKSIIDINDMKEGGIIKDDMGQWKYPGQITEIGSNQITMEGVPYDVLGISDTGDTKLMKPGKDYKFKGKKVTEFPMAKNGRRQEQKGLVNLDNLLNFTNYNKPQPGGWLDTL